MARLTKIGWTDSTMNFWIGCEKMGPGCDFCYAERDNNHRRWVDGWGPDGERKRTKTWGPLGKPLRGAPKNWMKEAPAFFAEHGRDRRVFCNSLADFFDKKAPAGARADAWAVIAATPMLEWQIVTKRVSNVEKMLPPDWGPNYQHIILIVTVCTQAEYDRDVPRLLMLKRKYPWLRVGLSIEPMLERIDPSIIRCKDFLYDSDDAATVYPLRGCYQKPGSHWSEDFPKLDWIICGGESGSPSIVRDFHLKWARTLARACTSNGIAFFMKQFGNRPTPDADSGDVMHARSGGMGKWDEPEFWPEDLRQQEFPEQRMAA